ncbi:MAG: PCP reductase family protein [Pseudomonadota bacterium]
MKFLCVACDEAMKSVPASGAPHGDSFAVVFRCPRCEHRVALLTNPGETRLARSLVSVIGGRAAAHQPPEMVRGAERTLPWSEDAEQRLQRVPDFIRPMVRESIERHAREYGLDEVTLQVMDEVRAKMGM